MKVCVLGNSVSLRMRPPRDADARPPQRTYVEWLEASGHRVRAVAASGVLITEAFATLDDDVVSWFPDWAVLNYGVVEVCYRQTIRAINNRPIRNYYLNRVFARPFASQTAAVRTADLFWRFVNAATRRVAGMLGLRWQWLSTDRYLEALEAMIGTILRETSARVIILGISPCSVRVERLLEGSEAAIADTNARMQALAGRLGGRVHYLSPERYSDGCTVDDIAPDGIHFSAEGHRRVAQAIEAVIASAR